MKSKGRGLSTIEFQVAGEPKLNPVLCHIFASDLNVHLHEEEMLAPFLNEDTSGLKDGKPGETALANCRRVIEDIALRAQPVPGLHCDLGAAISNFFRKARAGERPQGGRRTARSKRRGRSDGRRRRHPWRSRNYANLRRTRTARLVSLPTRSSASSRLTLASSVPSLASWSGRTP
ncbi:hypothetical protein [Terriglobus sp.]|uniref:hypothetical protein n=1 Tax=Terriglobus sp. TaxID=1889013 RepID=UPI003AFFD6D2